jgi:hypothetical protein
MKKEDVIEGLMAGHVLCDMRECEPGMCSNGGHYAEYYRLVKDALQSISSYEDAEWELEWSFQSRTGIMKYDVWEQVIGLAEYVERTAEEPCLYVSGERWYWSR